jgi:FtsZ-interacting cell division protein ZipA
MSGTAVAVLIVVIVLVLAVLLVLARMQARRRRLRERFGPEYERMVADADDPRAVEQELKAREKRHAELPIRALSADARDRYAREWVDVQERFVDEPVEAVSEADRLLTAVMAERGYPTEKYEQQVADLSVEHAGTLDRYRAAHDVSGRAAAGTATTEDLRQAMVHYRALFEELVQERVRPDGRNSG